MSARIHERWPEFRFYRYELPLIAPLRLKTGALTHKKGLLVSCSRDDRIGWGDIAPLDGYSRETFADVCRALDRVRDTLSQGALPRDAPPSLQCGLEFAWESYQASCNDQSLLDAWGGHQSGTRLAIAKLIPDDGTDGAAIDALNQAIQAGFTCFKIKVGQRPVRDDIRRVLSLLDIIPPDRKARLDANCGWVLDDAVRFCRSIPRARIEFLEEPLRNVDDYHALDEQVTFPLALDESLAGMNPGQLPQWKNLRHLVLKPSLLGGLAVCRSWLDWAEQNAMTGVISSMYESGLGIHGLASLAMARTPMIPAGLDTYTFLADDVVAPRWHFAHGAWAAPAAWGIDFNKLDQWP